jgi:hypothetical protein
LQTLRSKLNWGLDVRNWFYSFKNVLRNVFQMNKPNYSPYLKEERFDLNFNS